MVRVRTPDPRLPGRRLCREQPDQDAQGESARVLSAGEIPDALSQDGALFIADARRLPQGT